jgi:putative FmdB family regulatory protein
MPLYEYACADHGIFDAFRPTAEYLKAGDCPTCGAASPRVMSAPQIRAMTPMKRMAAERNEKSRHEPHVCTSGCGHAHKPKNQVGGKPKGTGYHAYAGPRPWVVEHR